MGETIISRDAGSAGLTVQHQPDGHATDCHALSVTTTATSGRGSAINAYTENSQAPVIRGQGPGPLLRLYNAAGSLKFEVGNDGTISTQTIGTLTVTGNATVGGTLGVTGATTLSGALTVSGYTTLSGAQANGDFAIFGNLSAFGTGKGYRFRTSGSSLDLEATGVDLLVSNWSGTNFDGTQRSYLRFAANALASQWAGKVEFVSALYGGGVHTLDGSANQLGFHGAAPVSQQTVTGSRGGNAALASLLTKLATLGLIVDGSSA